MKSVLYWTYLGLAVVFVFLMAANGAWYPGK